MDKSAKVYFGSSSRRPVDDSMNPLATVELVRVYVLRSKSPDVNSNKGNEGWMLVTRRKKVMKRGSWRAHERATNVPDGKQGAVKQVKKSPKEDVGHCYHQPHLVFLFKFFPKNYFGQVNKIQSSFMATSHQEIAIGELSTQEEHNLVVHTVKGLLAWLNLNEAMWLPEENQKALVKVLKNSLKYKTILEEIDAETTPCM
ncbi:hypothetical protein ACH5RR_022855 [Cinchona calisaya]|uniref:Uncharacterized protein n=1 Tax=Cinchona calisaya TaxID=153742 RepID=A0ABD2Z902_9GENT